MFTTLLRSRGRCEIRFVKVKRHATREDVRDGRVLVEDRTGNIEADRLAVAGAELHAVPKQVCDARAKRKASAIATHSMMLKILRRRLEIEKEIHGAGNCVDGYGDEGADPWSQGVVSVCVRDSAPRAGVG